MLTNLCIITIVIENGAIFLIFAQNIDYDCFLEPQIYVLEKKIMDTHVNPSAYKSGVRGQGCKLHGRSRYYPVWTH